jgi:small subunit ribosomal protein S5
LTKSIGTQNPINLVKATMDGLINLRRPEQVAELRGLTVAEVLGLQGNGASGQGSDELSSAGPVAAGDPPPPPVAEASSGAVPPTTPPAEETSEATEAPATEAEAPASAEEKKADEGPAAEESSS